MARDYGGGGLPSGRSLRIGAAAVAGVALLGVGVVVGRATAGGGHVPTTAGPLGSAMAQGVPSWATGATRMDHGVPVGYAHTQDGAMDAARNYDLALTSTPLVLDPEGYRAARAFLDVPSVREKDAARVERTLAQSAFLITAEHQSHATRSEPFLLTSHVDSYTGDEAQVTVWGGDVLASDGVVAPGLALAESTYSLRWLGDWRIVDVANSAGPAVAAHIPSPQTNALPAELGREFEGVGHVVPQ